MWRALKAFVFGLYTVRMAFNGAWVQGPFCVVCPQGFARKEAGRQNGYFNVHVMFMLSLYLSLKQVCH
jgi:hypothetical protein